MGRSCVEDEEEGDEEDADDALVDGEEEDEDNVDGALVDGEEDEEEADGASGVESAAAMLLSGDLSPTAAALQLPSAAADALLSLSDED